MILVAVRLRRSRESGVLLVILQEPLGINLLVEADVELRQEVSVELVEEQLRCEDVRE